MDAMTFLEALSACRCMTGQIAYPELEPDTSYGRVEDGSEWAVFAVPTQGSTNGNPE